MYVQCDRNFSTCGSKGGRRGRGRGGGAVGNVMGRVKGEGDVSLPSPYHGSLTYRCSATETSPPVAREGGKRETSWGAEDLKVKCIPHIHHKSQTCRCSGKETAPHVARRV